MPGSRTDGVGKQAWYNLKLAGIFNEDESRAFADSPHL